MMPCVPVLARCQGPSDGIYAERARPGGPAGGGCFNEPRKSTFRDQTVWNHGSVQQANWLDCHPMRRMHCLGPLDQEPRYTTPCLSLVCATDCLHSLDLGLPLHFLVQGSKDRIAWSSSLPQTTWSASGVLPVFWTEVPKTAAVKGGIYRLSG